MVEREALVERGLEVGQAVRRSGVMASITEAGPARRWSCSTLLTRPGTVGWSNDLGMMALERSIAPVSVHHALPVQVMPA